MAIFKRQSCELKWEIQYRFHTGMMGENEVEKKA
jgi:hypothetical protein